MLKTERSESMRLLLHEHVACRLKKSLAKWEGKSDSLAKQEIKKAQEKYVLERILEKGVACSSNIAVATHIAKAIHPDMKVKNVSNLNVRFSDLGYRIDIGSHFLSDDESLSDTTGDGAYNSTAYELYLLLDIRFDGQALGYWIKQRDKDAIAAFVPDIEDEMEAEEVAHRYAALLESKVPNFSSDIKAKQLYWSVSGEPADDAGYHLVQPLFSSSLAHVVHVSINDARFGEMNKEARQAYFKKAPHTKVYSDYRDLVIRKLGGTKPQNISQLNSERGGVNYLLGSLPPSWDQSRARNLLFIESAIDRFRSFEGVKELLAVLIKLLKSNPNPTMETRNKREAIERALGQALAAFGLEKQQLFEAGWTRSPDCKLVLCEQLWLDPERLDLAVRPEYEEVDTVFNQAYEWKDWPDEVAHRFGNWLNAILEKEGLPVGDAEHAHWAKQAINDCQWPAPMQRRAVTKNNGMEVVHG